MSCSSPKQSKVQVPKVESSTPLSTNESLITAEKYLQQATLATPQQSIELMLNAAEQYSIEQNELKALWLAQQITPLTNKPLFLYQLTIIKANALYSFNDLEQTNRYLNQAAVIAKEYKLEHSVKYYQLLSEKFSAKELHLQSVDAKLRAFSLANTSADIDIIDIWKGLTELSKWELDQLVLMKPPYIKGWYQLLNAANQYGDQPQKLSRAIIQWQRSYTGHPANAILNELSAPDELMLNNNQQIAILLPLSGKQSVAGKAAQQGILAAYNHNPTISLHFIDTNTQDIAELPTLYNERLIDYAIGPLLKSNVDKYVSQAINVPTLLLNIPSEKVMPEQYTALSMRREDEAKQAATTLSRQEFQFPMILSLTDNTSKRIAKAFTEQWQLINGDQPEVVYLENGANMQKVLKVTLDLDKSQTRIKEIESRIRQNIETESRNRRDIDMIYVIGSPRETRLLKPYIDVNISTYAKTVPVYASSLSHSANIDSSGIRDLRGLTFTEMPWFIQSKQQNTELAQRSKKLWPTRSDSLQRIFAMGYDSLGLINKIPAMQQRPYLRYFGQTGTLKINKQHILTRSLLWGKYTNNQVKEIAME